MNDDDYNRLLGEWAAIESEAAGEPVYTPARSWHRGSVPGMTFVYVGVALLVVVAVVVGWVLS